MMRFNVKKAVALLILSIQFSIILFSFQNCAKVNFSKEAAIELASKADPITTTVYEPPVSPAGPVHGDIVGFIKPFTIEEQSVVTKTKLVLVVDNSGTMSKSQENLTKGIDSILNSLQSQILNGLNPDVEFYIVTTTVPQVSLQPLSADRAQIFNFYGSGSNFDLYEPGQGYYFNTYRNNAQLVELNLLDPAGLKKFNHLNFEAGVKQNVHQIKNSWGYTMDQAAWDKYYEYLRSKDPNSISTDIYDAYAGQVFNDGSPFKYNASFEFNTNYPQKIKFVNGSALSSDANSIPFEKIVLNSNQYLSNPNSADRVFDENKFNSFKTQLKSKILAVGNAGSSKEMGLCALHRSLTMSGENKIFSKGDRAAFLIISDEDDAQKTWKECPLKATSSKEQPIISTISTSCITGSTSCLTPPAPARTADYQISYTYNYTKTTPANTSDKAIRLYASYSYSTNRAPATTLEKYFPVYATYEYSTEVPIYSTEGSKIIGSKKTSGYWDTTGSAIDIGFITAEELASLPGYKKNGDYYEASCRPVDQIAIQGVSYQTYSPTRVDALCKAVTFRSSLQTSSFQNYSYGGSASNETCKTLSGTMCTAAQESMVIAANCPAAASNCKVNSCIQYCSASVDTSTNYTASVSVGISTTDNDFAKSFGPGYDKKFDVKGYMDGFNVNTSFYPDNSGVTTFDRFLKRFQSLPADKISEVVASLKAVPAPVQNPKGTRSVSNVVTDYQTEPIKYSLVSDQTSTEIPNYKASASLVSNGEFQLVTSFHLRAQNLFGRNYFVSTIVVPNDGSYSTGQCPGVSDEQSVGSTYIKLLDDKYFTRKVIVDGNEVVLVDSARKSFADICKEDFSAALVPLYSFISKVPKNRYKVIIPAGREIHSVDIIQNGIKKPLSIKDWSYDGSDIIFDVDAVGIGDDVVVNLTVPYN